MADLANEETITQSSLNGTIVLRNRHIGLSFFICYIDTLHHDIPSYRSRLGHVFPAQLSAQSRVPFNSYAKIIKRPVC
jgi:hypothetical protein